MATTAISTMTGWGERRNKNGRRADFLDLHREEILQDWQTMGYQSTAEKWGMKRHGLSSVVRRWRGEGYVTPLLPKEVRQPEIKLGKALSVPVDVGCERATNFLGRQSHCITLNKNLDIDTENSCPFNECMFIKTERENDEG